MSILMITALAVLAAGGIGSALLFRRRRWCSLLGAGSAVAAAVLLLTGCFLEFALRGSTEAAFFRLLTALVGGAAAVYAPGYLAGESNLKNGFFHFFFNLTLAAMALVTVCAGFIPFLIVWEVMGLASFALTACEFHENQTQRAAWIYLLSCEAGGLLLMLAAAVAGPGRELLYFYLLLAGFGMKIGFPLLHVWLPEAHPAAPAPVSALMSAAMIPLGFCGLMRFMPHTANMPLHCGTALLVLGMLGAFGGIMQALMQNNLKRLLAYSSVENMGIAAMGCGLGFLGSAADLPLMAAAGFSGGILHLLNHALLKGALFLGAGAVLKSTGSLNIDQLGSLMKRLPRTGACFIFSSLGICGLPPFCGFTGELLIYTAAFAGIAEAKGTLFAGSLAAAAVLALTGAGAAAALIKAAAGVFTGEPRSRAAAGAAPEKNSMILPQMLLSRLAALLPLTAWVLPDLFGLPDAPLQPLAAILLKNAGFTLIVYVLFGLILFGRRRRLRDRRKVLTWDCGYAEPSARMEYTGSAFAQPLADQLRLFSGAESSIRRPEGLFPRQAAAERRGIDPLRQLVWEKLFACFSHIADRVHRFQSGYLHLYILTMVLALAAMLAWGFFA